MEISDDQLSVSLKEVSQLADAIQGALNDAQRMRVIDEFCSCSPGRDRLVEALYEAVDAPCGWVDSHIAEVPPQFHVEPWLPYRIHIEDIVDELVDRALAPAAHLDVPEKEFDPDGIEGIDWVWERMPRRKVSPQPRKDLANVRYFLHRVIGWMACEPSVAALDENRDHLLSVWALYFGKYGTHAPSPDALVRTLVETFYPTSERYAANVYLALTANGVRVT